MSKFRQIISVFLTFCLLLSLFPAQVIAVDETPAVPQAVTDVTETDVVATGHVSTGVQYNPLYDVPSVSGSSQKYYSGTGAVSVEDADYLTSAQEAAAVLRAGMVQRTADIPVYYRVDAAQCDGSEAAVIAIANEIFEQALAHTGISTEGDALRWVYESFNADISYLVTEEYYYFEYTFHVAYYTTAEQEAVLTAQVDQVLSGFAFDENTDDYTKIKTVYDYICDNVVYDYDNLNDASHKLKFTAYAALINGTSVCQGYALLLYRMLLDVGVDCRVITGIGGGDHHAWNIIAVDGAYYNADSTWDAGVAQYGYFLTCDANFPDHTREDSYTTESFHAAYPMGTADYDPNEASGGESGKVAFGTCGDNLTWVLDEEGVLTISGEGNMTSNPWNDYNDLIQTVVIKDGVTSLISCAFSGCLALKEVVLPNTLSSTGVSTFNGCVSLKNIHIPSEVEHIGIGTFLGCTSLETVSFSGELKTIGTDAFRDCVSLKRMDVPLSVQVIGDTSFYGCTGLECVSIAAAAIGDWVFADCTSLQEVDLGEDITSIGMGAFARCSALENIQLPVALLHLERDVFSECASLTSIAIPKDVTDIGESAFFACRSLQTIALPDGLETIGAGAFQYTAIESLIIPSNVSRIENGTFYGSSIKTLTLGENVKHIGNAFTFSDLESLHLPASVESIDTSSWGLSAMRTISVDEDNPYFKAIDGVLYNKDGSELIYCPPQRSGEFVIPNTVVKLCDSAFYGCENMTEITIPATVTFYGDNLFVDCSNLTRVILCEGMTTIPNGLFRFCTNLETVSIPESVTHIGDNAFLGCGSLQSFHITKNIQTIGTDAFAGCTYTYFSVDPDNQSYVIENGVIYTKDMRILVYATKSAPKELIIPDGVEIISSESLHNDEAAISTIVFPDSVEQIGNQACLGMTELRDVEFGSNLTSIGQSAFSCCDALREIVIPNTKPLCIGDSAFKECYALESVVITGSVDEIGVDAFSYCNALKTINIPKITSRCGAYVFSDTAYYGNEENWKNGGLYVGGWLVAAFVGADGHFIIEEGTCGIAQYVFLDNLNLTEVTIPGSVQIINDCAFQGCRALKQVNLEFGLERIEELAFVGCEVLEELVIPASVKYLGSEFWALGWYNRVKFVGCAPYFHENAFGNMGPTVVYYPANDATWTQHIGKQFGAPTLQLRDNDGYVIEEVDGITWCEYIRNICTEHTYNQVVTPPTHTEQGYTTHTCTICGDSFVDSYVDALGHTEVTDPAVAPTCTETGLTEGSHCDVCSEVLVAQEVVDALGHTYDDGAVTTEPTCADEGVKTFTCSICGSIKTETVEATGEHEYENGFCIVCGEEEIYTGTCGDDLTWVLTEDGTLTISGTGGITSSPWGDYKELIQAAVIEEGVTSIGSYAFQGCSALTSVELPDTLMYLRDGAFSDCSALTEITVPSSLTSIGQAAFSDCSSLTEIVIPEGVTSIDSGAFSNCTALTEITFSGDAPAIASTIFFHVTATVYYPAGNDTWTDDVIQNYGGTLTWKARCLDHVAVTDPAVAPTCTETGLTEGSHCSVCGEVLVEQEVVDALGHTWTSAAAVQPGFEQKVCTGCAGVMRIPLSGWVHLDGTWYHCTQPGVVDTGWHFVDGQLHYFSTNGAAATGWQQIDGARYYFDSLGALVAPDPRYAGITQFYPDDSGEMVPGWKQLDDTWYYFNESGCMVPGWREIRGTLYYYTDSGSWMPCWKEIGGTWYYYSRSDTAEPYWQIIGGFWDCPLSSGVNS